MVQRDVCKPLLIEESVNKSSIPKILCTSNLRSDESNEVIPVKHQDFGASSRLPEIHLAEKVSDWLAPPTALTVIDSFKSTLCSLIFRCYRKYVPAIAVARAAWPLW